MEKLYLYLMVSQVPLAMTLALDVRFLVFIQTMRRFLKEACFDLFLAEAQAWIWSWWIGGICLSLFFCLSPMRLSQPSFKSVKKCWRLKLRVKYHKSMSLLLIRKVHLPTAETRDGRKHDQGCHWLQRWHLTTFSLSDRCCSALIYDFSSSATSLTFVVLSEMVWLLFFKLCFIHWV